ncbi:hypothetical protein GJ496_000201 [Pomphorhynchus laevis]|nr:hypothetical protein GJ496_000201 [Pomphorhynchus laevis]
MSFNIGISFSKAVFKRITQHEIRVLSRNDLRSHPPCHICQCSHEQRCRLCALDGRHDKITFDGVKYH